MNGAVITGCDSGIGKSLVEVFLSRGYRCIISYLEENPFAGREGVSAVRVDLCSEKDILCFVNIIDEKIREGMSLDFFVNNAGIALGGPFENLPLEIYRKVFEVNYFGLISVTGRIIPLLLKSRGRLVIIGSMAGRVALPFLSPYVSSKYALEGWCDSVRRELNPFGISTILIEPGGIATPIWNKAKGQDRSFIDPKYRRSMDRFTDNFIEGGNKGMDPDRAALRIFSCITKKNPRPRCIIAGNRFLSYLETMIPDRILDRIVIRLFDMKYGNDRMQK